MGDTHLDGPGVPLAERERWWRRRAAALRPLLATAFVVGAMCTALALFLSRHPLRPDTPTLERATDLASIAVTAAVCLAGLADALAGWRRTRPLPCWSAANEPPIGGVYACEEDDASVFAVAQKLLGDADRWREIWVLNCGHRVARGHVWTLPHQRLLPGYTLAVPDAALRRLARAATAEHSSGGATAARDSWNRSSGPADARWTSST